MANPHIYVPPEQRQETAPRAHRRRVSRPEEGPIVMGTAVPSKYPYSFEAGRVVRNKDYFGARPSEPEPPAELYEEHDDDDQSVRSSELLEDSEAGSTSVVYMRMVCPHCDCSLGLSSVVLVPRDAKRTPESGATSSKPALERASTTAFFEDEKPQVRRKLGGAPA